MQANIDLKITSKSGGAARYEGNKGLTVILIDNEQNYIAVDAFTGYGTNYKRRDKSQIEIFCDGKIWTGTFEELASKLNLI